MKRTYMSPTLAVVQIESANLMAGSPIKIDPDKSGSGQLSKKFWGAAPWETREEAAEDEEESIY